MGKKEFNDKKLSKTNICQHSQPCLSFEQTRDLILNFKVSKCDLKTLISFHQRYDSESKSLGRFIREYLLTEAQKILEEEQEKLTPFSPLKNFIESGGEP